MNTGTPLDLTPFGALLTAMGLLYWALALGVAALVLWWFRPWWAKLLAVASVVAVFAYPVVMHLREERQQHDEAKSKLTAAMALFNERCKSAGEKITRTVEDVEGVVWMRWREKYTNEDNFADQWKLNDPYGNDCGGADCIEGLLRVTVGASLRPDETKRHESGYRFVETVDPRDGKRYRYTASLEQSWNQEAIDRHKREKGGDLPSYSYQFKTRRIPIEAFTARYGVSWDDISTREDRQHWIASSSLKVVDLRNNEVIAERIGYMVDQGQGSQVGFRSPWLFAQYTACPAFDRSESNSPIKTSRSRAFVFKVLHIN